MLAFLANSSIVSRWTGDFSLSLTSRSHASTWALLGTRPTGERPTSTKRGAGTRAGTRAGTGSPMSLGTGSPRTLWMWSTAEGPGRRHAGGGGGGHSEKGTRGSEEEEEEEEGTRRAEAILDPHLSPSPLDSSSIGTPAARAAF